jgi:scyllo-inositol 2-dehydrogenase (NADP+)
MRIAVVGLGVQGKKRRALAGDRVTVVVDPVAEGVPYRGIEAVPLEDFDAAFVCVPDQAKVGVLRYLLERGKHVLVEKPLLATEAEIEQLMTLADRGGLAAYTAYNHRFEPHIAALKAVVDSGELGRVYFARFFYGNGTARDVRNSVWRDEGLGVFSDLGSHLLDMAHFLFGPHEERGVVWSVDRFENRAPDHVLFGYRGERVLEMEVTLLSWRNSFALEVFGEKGSAHIDCLCKWGPSTLRVRTRILPSGRPIERVETLEQADPTWALEQDHFLKLCGTGGSNFGKDLWILRKMEELRAAIV